MLSPICIVDFMQPKRKDYTTDENPITKDVSIQGDIGW